MGDKTISARGSQVGGLLLILCVCGAGGGEERIVFNIVFVICRAFHTCRDERPGRQSSSEMLRPGGCQE